MTELPKNRYLDDEGPSSNGCEATAEAQLESEHLPDQSATQNQPDERVGYRSPPRRHQFKKGQSGNPRGRPKKSVNRHTVIIRSLNEAALAEAQRVIGVGRGADFTVTTVMEAVLGGISEKAINGDIACSRLLLQFVSAAQKHKDEQQLGFLKALAEYKSGWEQEIEVCYRNRRPPTGGARTRAH